MFDRPSLNISALATPLGGTSFGGYRDVGFMTSRFGNEDTGFVRQKVSLASDCGDTDLTKQTNRTTHRWTPGTLGCR